MTSLRLCFSVVQMPVLPIEPGMAQLMGEYVAASGHREPLAEINRLGVVIPDSIRVRVAPIHFRIGHLSYGDSIAEGKDNS